MTNTQAPLKGTVWLHARRKNYDGTPQELTVTSIQKQNGRDIVYSKTRYHDRVKTPLAIWEDMCIEVVSVPEPAETNGPKFTSHECQALYMKAHDAGMAAGQAHSPRPMTVVQRANPLDDNSPIVHQYAPVMDGVCGFASIIVRPGNSSFARWLKAQGIGRTSYSGGVSVRVSQFGQSYERKMAYANAFAKALEEVGIKAYPDGRLD